MFYNVGIEAIVNILNLLVDLNYYIVQIYIINH